MYLFNHITHNFLFLQPPINKFYIYGYKDILLVCNNISFPVRFYICDVKAPLLGLHDIFDSGVILHINGKDNSSVEHQGESEPLYHHHVNLNSVQHVVSGEHGRGVSPDTVCWTRFNPSEST